MQFNVTEEQEQLRDSVSRFVRERYTFDTWRRHARKQQGFDLNTWQEIANLGWMAVAIPEQYGGLGMGARERGVIMEAFGAGLVLEPYWSSSVMCVELLRLAGTDAQKSRYLPGIADGSVRGAFALFEQNTRYDWSEIACRAERSSGGWVLRGDKLAVLDGPCADRVMVVARTAASPGDPAGLSLFCVRSDSSGLVRRDYRTADERGCSDLSLNAVAVCDSDLIGVEGQAATALAEAIDQGIAALCAEAVGTMSSALNATVEYLKTRKQFGRPLAEFQVLRHRVADMVMALEQSRSAASLCALSLSDEPTQRSRVAAAAKAQIGTAGRFIGESAVQLHGGIGVTDELQIGHFFKRLLTIDVLLGDTRHHLSRMALARQATGPTNVAAQ